MTLHDESATIPADLPALVRTAIESVLTFWHAESATFDRDSTVIEGTVPRSPTSTARCIQSLIDYLCYSDRSDHEDEKELRRTCREVLTRFAAAHVEIGPVEAWIDGGTNGSNEFTNQQLALTWYMVAGVAQRFDDPTLQPDPQILDLCTHRRPKVGVRNAGPYFSQMAASRASAAAPRRPPRRRRAPAAIDLGKHETAVAAQLGFLGTGASWRFDLMELLGAVGLLSTYQHDAANPILASALARVPELQLADGTWSFARAVSLGQGKALYVSSHEISLALVNICLNCDALRLDERVRLLAPIEEVLARAATLAESSLQRTNSGLQTREGWANEQLRGDGIIESWTTAVVAQMLIRTVWFRQRLHSDLALVRLRDYGCRVEDRATRRAPGSWSDLERLVHIADPVTFAFPSDPTRDQRVNSRITKEVLAPINRCWNNLPPLPNHGTAAMLVPGPPGSRKSSLMRQLAGTLGWPLVTVSPPVFLQEGLEGFEARATQVFNDLMSLQRCVAFFDECEELIRLRDAETLRRSAPFRGMASHTTSGMLDRLQQLRDTSNAFFAFATNADGDDLDGAAQRLGRFDAIVRLGYPTEEARQRYVENSLKRSNQARLGARGTAHEPNYQIPPSTITEVAKIVAAGTSCPVDETSNEAPQGVPFSLLDRILRVSLEELLPAGPPSHQRTLEVVSQVTRRLRHRTGPTDLLAE